MSMYYFGTHTYVQRPYNDLFIINSFTFIMQNFELIINLTYAISTCCKGTFTSGSRYICTYIHMYTYFVNL